MNLPFVSRRHHEQTVARLNADRERLAQDRDTVRRQAEAVSEKYADACIVNECLAADLAAARKRLAEHDAHGMADLVIGHDIHRRNLAAALGEETRDLTWDALGLDREAVRDGRHWQQTRQDKGTVRP